MPLFAQNGKIDSHEKDVRNGRLRLAVARGFRSAKRQSDEGKPLVFSKAEFVGNLTVRMIRSDTARIEIKQSQSESNRLDWGQGR
ncbi:MAG: hypothetical protein ACLTTP_08770 [Alistipes ihumii]